MEPVSLESTNKLLKIIIALMLRSPDERPASLKERIEILFNVGLRPAEIAEILGKTGTHINKELSASGIRKKRKGK